MHIFIMNIDRLRTRRNENQLQLDHNIYISIKLHENDTQATILVAILIG